MAKELMEIGGFITEGAEIVNHDASLSGHGSIDSPLGISSDFIVTTSESAGTYSVNTSDVGISHNFSKTGYKPIAWTYKFGNAGFINFNQEGTYIDSDNILHFQGYARRVLGSGAVSITMTVLITWVKV